MRTVDLTAWADRRLYFVLVGLAVVSALPIPASARDLVPDHRDITGTFNNSQAVHFTVR